MDRLATAMEGQERPFILDVRTEGEFRSGHLPGARNVPLHRLGAGIGAIPKDRTVVCVCRSGHRSAVGVTALRRGGVEAVSLRGGMLAWRGQVVGGGRG